MLSMHIIMYVCTRIHINMHTYVRTNMKRHHKKVTQQKKIKNKNREGGGRIPFKIREREKKNLLL